MSSKPYKFQFLEDLRVSQDDQLHGIIHSLWIEDRELFGKKTKIDSNTFEDTPHIKTSDGQKLEECDVDTALELIFERGYRYGIEPEGLGDAPDILKDVSTNWKSRTFDDDCNVLAIGINTQFGKYLGIRLDGAILCFEKNAIEGKLEPIEYSDFLKSLVEFPNKSFTISSVSTDTLIETLTEKKTEFLGSKIIFSTTE